MENPAQLGMILLLTIIISSFFLCGFRRWKLLALVSINVSVSLLVSLGVIYTDSTFLLESMFVVLLFASALCLLNLQNKFSYSSGVMVCFVFLIFLVSLWHFLYLPYSDELSNIQNMWGTAGPKIERLVALICTVSLCCGYILYYEEKAKSQYLLNEDLEAAIYLYIHVLFFIYVMLQIFHFWSVRCRRARRGMEAYSS